VNVFPPHRISPVAWSRLTDSKDATITLTLVSDTDASRIVT
jgi:hypothetical protein